ncbi:unnamed protein product [Rotaria socialis]|uniref:Amine oxidase n=1 Tax=Rotaria socialis TaxID=392032 RepID=A0A818X8T2_9BILA|nr:unnamed protein product [Rotaria socialis]CAF4694564.1 unnamed protein product [Rotaria socialis]
MTANDEIFDVIIVGCGSAGIAAAIDLQTVPQLKFTIVEARDRVGGRVSTDRTTFGTDKPIDLGAQWIHHYRSEHPLHKYNELCTDIHTKNYFSSRSSGTQFCDIDGTKIGSDKVSDAEKIFNNLYRTIKESSPIIDKSMLDVIKTEYNSYENNPQMKRLLDLFFGNIEQYEGSNIDELSAKSFFNSDNGMIEYNLALPNGFGTFLEQLVLHYQLPVQLKCIVTRIDASSSDSIVRLSTRDGRTLQCKYVLITIPLGCLKARSIEFIPDLPDWKQKAIDVMGMGLADKIFVEFPYVFWDPTLPSIYCTSPQFRFILCRPNDCILQIKIAARIAYDIEQKDDKQTIDEFMKLLRTIFSDQDVPEPTRFLMTRWAQDPFARGAYSNFGVGSDKQTLLDLARECHNRIHWAGEHTNHDGSIGCVDSAFESGQREAKKLIEKLKE